MRTIKTYGHKDLFNKTRLVNNEGEIITIAYTTFQRNNSANKMLKTPIYKLMEWNKKYFDRVTLTELKKDGWKLIKEVQ